MTRQDDRTVFLTEAEASRLWERAAELQLRASQRAEARSKELRGLAGASGLAAGEHVRIDDVMGAGREVGIDEDHLATALAEIIEDRANGTAAPLDAIERFAVRALGRPPLVVEATRLIPMPLPSVYRILQRILPEPPLGLRLRQTLGQDPLRDGVLIFDAPIGDNATPSYTRDVLMARGKIPRISVTIRDATDGAGESTRVTIRGKVEADHEPAFWLGSAVTSSSAVAGGLAGGTITAGFTLVGAVAVASVAGLALAGGGAGYWFHRNRYLGLFERSRNAMYEVLEVLEAAVRTDGGFLPARGTSREARDPQGARGLVGG